LDGAEVDEAEVDEAEVDEAREIEFLDNQTFFRRRKFRIRNGVDLANMLLLTSFFPSEQCLFWKYHTSIFYSLLSTAQ
jgi:hypothetical protein